MIFTISETNYSTIGKFNSDYVVFDLEINPIWTEKEKFEYCKSNTGYYNNWTYDITSKKIKKQLFEWINELPENKRTKIEVIRYLMSKMKQIIEGKWDDNFLNGHLPSYWIGSEQIFENVPAKYGQCWCFAEVMTGLCKMLNIPARTIFGKNVLIDENLDGGIDFKEDLRKSEGDVNFSLINRQFLNRNLSELTTNSNSKNELWEELKIFDCGDTFWSIHYWNEAYIDGSWYTFDSTPGSYGKDILGPYSISESIGYDSEKILSMVNLPFRLWATETIIEGDNIVNIPYVYSIIYPHSFKRSKYLKLPKIMNIFDKGVDILTKHPEFKKINITQNYLLSDNNLNELYYKNTPLDGIFYIQTVYLDSLGNILHITRINSTINNIKDENIHGSYIKSYLLIELVENGNPRWFTFCKYC